MLQGLQPLFCVTELPVQAVQLQELQYGFGGQIALGQVVEGQVVGLPYGAE